MDQENNNNENQENNNSMEDNGNNNFDVESISGENQNIMDNENMITEVNDNIRDVENQENNANIENIDENQNNKDMMETNDNVNNEVIQTNENQELRINFENGDEKEKIIDKIKNSCIYQERKIKDKENLNNLIKELITEGSNVLEKGIDEKSEDIIKLFRKMERNKLKQIINGYQFAKLVIKEREERYERIDKQKAVKEVNKKIWKGMPGYNYKTIVNNVLKAIKVHEMFNKIGKRKRIMKIKDFTWLYISRLNEEERQYVINKVKAIEKGDNGLNEN
ncbi:unnamed protein product [Rhizophagus irregularis]|nr:unnamed protein product [Rhizophagus irregularis]